MTSTRNISRNNLREVFFVHVLFVSNVAIFVRWQLAYRCIFAFFIGKAEQKLNCSLRSKKALSHVLRGELLHGKEVCHHKKGSHKVVLYLY